MALSKWGRYRRSTLINMRIRQSTDVAALMTRPASLPKSLLSTISYLEARLMQMTSHCSSSLGKKSEAMECEKQTTLASNLDLSFSANLQRPNSSLVTRAIWVSRSKPVEKQLIPATLGWDEVPTKFSLELLLH